MLVSEPQQKATWETQAQMITNINKDYKIIRNEDVYVIGRQWSKDGLLRTQ
jgi:hypothetical protein